ncbi:MAG: MFS transporter [Ignavibacteria bacterium GWB2_35_6b]|nr:MAG: MFS transporter [Ignavibacteria bacterium GWB2_35_6b]
MIKRIIKFFATGEDKPLLENENEIKRIYEKKRWSVLISLILGYGFFYTCRLGLSVAKKPILDAGVLSVSEMGIIGSVLLYVYAVGKFTNGMLSDRANIKRFMSIALMLSALVNILFGLTNLFIMFVILWGLNGWFQSIGSAPSVVSICQWYSNKERGTRYGIWAGAHNIGEGLTFVVTAFLVSLFGWRAGFIGPGIICIFVALALYNALADRPQTYGLPHVADYKKDYSAGKPITENVGKLQRMVLKNPYVWILGLSSALMYVARYAINNWAILFLQESKHYELMDASYVMGAYPIMGFIGASFSGFISDKLFNSRRNIPTLVYGLMETSGIVMLFLVPEGHMWLDTIAMGLFGFGVGGLIVFLSGLIAVDITPKVTAGTVKGLIGMFSYIGAATQDWISGFLLESSKIIIEGKAIYNFDDTFYFWIGASVLSMLLALTVWNAKPKE